MVCLGRLVASSFLKAVFHKFYLVYSWISWPICRSTILVSSYLLRLVLVNSIASFDLNDTFWLIQLSVLPSFVEKQSVIACTNFSVFLLS